MNNDLDVFFGKPNTSSAMSYVGTTVPQSWTGDTYLVSGSAGIAASDFEPVQLKYNYGPSDFLPTEHKVKLSPEQEAQLDKMWEDKKKADAERLLKADPSSATKLDQGKTDWSLMPWEAVEEINKVLEFGAAKYNEVGKSGPDSWNWAKGAGLGKRRLLSAIFRHLFAYARGEKTDPESGLSHIAHAGCSILFILFYQKNPVKYTNE